MSTPSQDTEAATGAPATSHPVFAVTCKYASMFDNDEAAQFKVEVTLSAPKVTASDKETLEKAREGFATLLETCRDHLMAGFQFVKVLPDPRAYKEQWPSLCKSVVQDAIDNDASLSALHPRCEVQLTDWKDDDVLNDANDIKDFRIEKLSEHLGDWQEVCRLGKERLAATGMSVTPRPQLLPNAIERTETTASLWLKDGKFEDEDSSGEPDENV